MNPVMPHVAHESDIEVGSWDGIVAWRTLLSGDRTPSSGLTLGVAEIAPGSSEQGALHHHGDHEAYYFIAGRGEVHLQFSDVVYRFPGQGDR